MGATSIRLSEETKTRLELRKRRDESFEEVIERLLDDDRDLLAGFGAWEDTDTAETVREIHEGWKRESGDRIDRIAKARDSSDDDDQSR